MTVVDGTKAVMILRRVTEEPVAEIVQCGEPLSLANLSTAHPVLSNPSVVSVREVAPEMARSHSGSSSDKRDASRLDHWSADEGGTSDATGVRRRPDRTGAGVQAVANAD